MKNIQATIEKTIIDIIENNGQYQSVLVGLSGGVDSAVSAWLLKEAGYKVSAVFLKCYPNTPGCKSEEDLKDAVEVASRLDIPLTTMDFIEEYRRDVLENFYQEYEKGRTPNPDILCNEKIKFGSFFDKAMKESGADYFATGHYVRKVRNSLTRGRDEGKDQSYFLYRIPQSALDKSIFPVGGLLKEQVREIAQKAGLSVADKQDSTGICFIGPVDLKDFLSERITISPGDVVTKQGDVIGTHKGVWFYTIGQRHGFETKLNLPLYVIKKDVKKNHLIVGEYKDTFLSSFEVDELFWRVDQVPDSFSSLTRVRNLGSLVPASINLRDGTAYISTQEPIQSIAPGQSVVFYQDEVVIGGGIIK